LGPQIVRRRSRRETPSLAQGEARNPSSTIGQAFFCLQRPPVPPPYAWDRPRRRPPPLEIIELSVDPCDLSSTMPSDVDAMELKRQALDAAGLREPSSSSSASSLSSLSRTVEPLVRRDLLPPKAPSDGASANLTVQSLPYVKYRESVSAVFSFDSGAMVRRTPHAPSDPTRVSAIDKGTNLPVSYSVPSITMIANTPRGRPAVDVIATYMNTTDRRTVKSELMRAHAHFASPRGTCCFTTSRKPRRSIAMSLHGAATGACWSCRPSQKRG
jgi:hypothetical protein